jgi:cleavage and polyadenylation specificity factor subunit 1
MSLLKDDRSVTLLKADKKGELEELELPHSLIGKVYSSASLFADDADFFQASRLQPSQGANVLLVLLATDGTLTIVPASNPKTQVFLVEGVSFLPHLLAPDMQLPKHWRNNDDLADAVLANLGSSKDPEPYLVIRNTTGDVMLYEPFALPDVVGSFRFRKLATHNADYNNDSTIEEDGEAPIIPPKTIPLSLAAGIDVIIVPGEPSVMIAKQQSTSPRIYRIGQERIRSVCRVEGVEEADFGFVDERGDFCLAQISASLLLGHSPWVIHRKDLGKDVTSIAYFEETSSYVVATNEPTPFQLPQDDEWHPEWTHEKTGFLPTTTISTLQLISSYTHDTISEYTFDDSEKILSLKTMSLETSEITHRQRPLVVVGTGIAKGENIVTRGHMYLFSVAEVVPRPGVLESDLKLKLLSTEDVRGAVTTLAPIGSQGFVLAAQGQKCMVRGLREDMSILPVAFLDMRYYTSISKSLAGTGLCILGDAFSGLWLVGYSEEPYKLQLLSQDFDSPSVLAADFLPTENGKELYIVAADDDGVLRMLQYDPENPKSDRGERLLLRSTFNTGDTPTTMTLLPRSPTSYETALSSPGPSPPQSPASSTADSLPAAPTTTPPKPRSQLLLTHLSGAISLITNLDEASYRRLSTLQNILISQIEHPCSLNPRAYRNVDTDGVGGRAVIDADLVAKWLNLSSQHKASLADKVGARAVWELRGDLEAVLGGGMGFMA